MVIVEDLQIGNMSRSAAGTLQRPGRTVRHRSGLNQAILKAIFKAILDQGGAKFQRQLEYKMLWAGGLLLAVPPQNTSRTCPHCGQVSCNNRRTQADLACIECGLKQNADWVAAINVLRAGHARLACEVNGEVGRQQQEPTETARWPLR